MPFALSGLFRQLEQGETGEPNTGSDKLRANPVQIQPRYTAGIDPAAAARHPPGPAVGLHVKGIRIERVVPALRNLELNIRKGNI